MRTAKSEDPLNDRLAALEHELQQRRQQQEAEAQIHKNKSAEEKELPLPRLVILIDSLPEGYPHSALDVLAKQGRELGVFCIYLCSKQELIHGSCGGAPPRPWAFRCSACSAGLPSCGQDSNRCGSLSRPEGVRI